MENKLFTIKQALDELEISKSKLYGLFKQLGIQTQKEKGKTYLRSEQIRQIKNYIQSSTSSTQYGHFTQPKTKEDIQHLQEAHSKEIERIEQEKEELKRNFKQDLERERKEKAQITLLLGQAQGEAKAYKEQNQKLLESKAIEATPNDDEEEKSPPKKSFWSRIFK